MAEPISSVLREVEQIVQCFGKINWGTAGKPVCEPSPLQTSDSALSSSCHREASAAAPSAAVGGSLNVLECARAAGLDLVWLQLKRARQALQATISEAASQTATAAEDGAAVQREAAAATRALSFVAAAVTTPGGQDLRIAAAEAQGLLNQLSSTLSLWQHRRTLEAAEAARQAAAAGDFGALASSAVRAKGHVAMALWAACLGGPKVLQELSGGLDAANRDADGALQLLWGPTATTPGAGGSKDPPENWVCVPPEGSEEMVREEALGAAAAGVAGEGVGVHSVDSIAPTQNPAQPAASSAGDAAGVDASHQRALRRRPDERPSTIAASPPQSSPPSPLTSSSTESPLAGPEAATAHGPAGDAAAEAAPPDLVASAVETCAESMSSPGPRPGLSPMAGTADTALAAAQAAQAATQTSSTSSPPATVPLGTLGATAAPEGGSSPTAAHEAAVASPVDATSSSPEGPVDQAVSGGCDRSAEGPQGRAGRLDPNPGRDELRPRLSDPSAADGDALQVVMRLLLKAAEQTVENGQVRDDGSLYFAAKALEMITTGWGTGNTPEQNEAQKQAEVLALWDDTSTRVALLQLISYTVRKARALLASRAPAMSLSARSLLAMSRSLDFLLAQLLSSRFPAEQRFQALQLLSSTDMTQCLVGALADMAAKAAARLRNSSLEPAVAEVPLCDLPTTVTEPETAFDESIAAAELTVRDVQALLRRDGWVTDLGFRSGDSIKTHVFSMFNNLITSTAALHATTPTLRETQRALQGALLRSQALEHLVRSLVLVWHGERAHSAVCDDGSVEGNMTGLIRTMQLLLGWSFASDKPLAVLANLLLSGPSVQRLLLLHAVSQVCATDGGTDYGLPQHARMPALVYRRDGSLSHRTAATIVMTTQGLAWAATNPRNHDLNPAHHQQQELQKAAPLKTRLLARVMASSFWWWAANRARPCSDRALRAVCERVAGTALVAARASSPGSASSPTAAGGSGGNSDVHDSAGALRFAVDDAVCLALSSLECAVTLVHNGSAGSLRRLSAPVVQAANVATLIRAGGVRMCGLARPLRLLVMLPLPPLRADTSGAGPGPDLAPLLAAGYTAALERTIRSELRHAIVDAAATGASSGLVGNLKSITRLLERGPGLANLLAHEEPLTSIALMSSLVKAVIASHALSMEQGASDANNNLGLGAAVIAAVRRMFTAGAALIPGVGSICPAAHKCMAHPGDGAGEVPGNGAGEVPGDGAGEVPGDGAGEVPGDGAGEVPGDGAGAGSVAWGGLAELVRGMWSFKLGQGVDGDGTGHLSKESAGGSRSGSAAPPSLISSISDSRGALVVLSQLSSLAGLFMVRWLPTLLGLLHSLDNRPAANGGLELADLANMYCSALFYVNLAVQALLVTREARTAATQRRLAGAAHTETAMAEAMLAAAGRTPEDADADSWEALLMGTLDMPALLVQAARLITPDVPDWRGKLYTPLMGPLAISAQHLLVAFPRVGRRMLLQKIKPKVSFFELLRAINLPAHAGKVDARARHCLEVAEALRAGQDPSPRDIRRLRCQENTQGAALAEMLMPPRLVLGSLEHLPMCGNVMCANLLGDSEKELGLPVPGKGGVRYCKERCRVQHWQDDREAQVRIRSWSRDA